MKPIPQLTAWLGRRDPGFAATRRAGRTALVMPALSALCSEVLHAPAAGNFAAFGTIAMLLLVDFSGTTLERLRSHAALGVAWLLLVTLGTLAAHSIWTAVGATVLVGFAVLFSGVVSSVLAGATTALLLAFVLPVSADAPLSQLPDRLLGVVLATVSAMIAVTVLWPRTPQLPLSAPAAEVCRAAARQLRAEARHYADKAGSRTFAHCVDCVDSTGSAAHTMRRAFLQTPYRPTGLSTGSRALVRLVDELTWLAGILAESGPDSADDVAADAESVAVRLAAAEVLELSAGLLEKPGLDLEPLRAAAGVLRRALALMEERAVVLLPAPDGPGTAAGAETAAGAAGATAGAGLIEPVGEIGPAVPTTVEAFIGSLDASFRAQEVAFVVLQVAQNVDTALAADRRRWSDRLLGREPGATAGALASARERALAHLEPHSVWLHNSIRGAAGLGIAVALADKTGVQHSFWVILGTLSVLRSNALNTGQNAFRALGGTVVGSVLGAILLNSIGHNKPLLWVLLPVAVLIAGILPAAVSFAAGQAAFTVTLVILFDISQPAGLSLLYSRVEDIALGCAVSLGVGLFFWPRGAAAAVGKALAEAYADSARYLVGAVDFAVSCTGTTATAFDAAQEGRRAAAAARRLDDAYRTFLAERGAKARPLGEITTLVTGVVGLRLIADAVLELWRRAPAGVPAADRTAAQKELLVLAERNLRWYEELAGGIEGRSAVPDPLPSDRQTATRLAEAVRRDLYDPDGRATGTGVRIIWTGDSLEAVRRLQPELATAAGKAGPAPVADPAPALAAA